MIGSIRKHSAWLWWVVAGLTIISFVWWGTSPQTRYGNRSGGFGTIYGKAVTPEAFAAAQREFYIFYWMQRGEFPDRNASMNRTEIERETYVRLLLTRKAEQLGIHVGQEALADGAKRILSEIGRNGQAVPMTAFLEKVLQPEGLTADDFERFVRDDLVIQQLVQSLGLPGSLVPPQEAGQIYDREHQEVSAQAVFFSASNYLSQVTVTPAAVGQFYTNYMAAYRLPDRVQINYLEFDLTNFLAAAEQKIGKTNLAAQVNSYYAQHGNEAVPEAKTPEEAKAKIRDGMLRQAAMAAAADKAKEFVTELFAMDPVTPENLVTLAQKKGLPMHTTAPFSEADGPQEFPAPTELIQTAFKLNADSPFSKPLAGAEAVYVIGLANQLTSQIPPLAQIHDRVAHDYQLHEAAMKARAAGTNFYFSTAVQMAAGKTFAQAAIGEGQTPIALKPFSLSSEEVPEAEGHAEVNQIKEAALIATQPGHISRFVATAEGGFVLFVQSLLPVDEAVKNVEMPKFLSQIRRTRENEAFNTWLQTEANRELRDTSAFADATANKTQPSP